jgi:hypothetical protein
MAECKVINIRETDPKAHWEFFVDTNVWYWTTYTRASHVPDGAPTRYQSEQYPRFILKSLNVGASILRTEVSFFELAHVIERAEMKIFTVHRRTPEMRLKQFRRQASERARVVGEIDSSWKQVVKMSDCVDFKLAAGLGISTLTRLPNCMLDSYDHLHHEAIIQSKKMWLLTDDADFASLEDLTILTSNRMLIEGARQRGCLLAQEEVEKL